MDYSARHPTLTAHHPALSGAQHPTFTSPGWSVAESKLGQLTVVGFEAGGASVRRLSLYLCKATFSPPLSRALSLSLSPSHALALSLSLSLALALSLRISLSISMCLSVKRISLSLYKATLYLQSHTSRRGLMSERCSVSGSICRSRYLPPTKASCQPSLSHRKCLQSRCTKVNSRTNPSSHSLYQ